MKKKKLWISLAVAVVALGLLAWSPIGQLVFFLVDLRFLSYRLHNPDLQLHMAKTMALYCQSDHALFPDCLTELWLPPAFDGLDHPVSSPSMTVCTNEGSANWAGGFIDAFGYILRLNHDASTETTNVWQLYSHSKLHGYHVGTQVLSTLVLEKSQKLTADDILSQFDRFLPNCEAYRIKIQFLLKLGRLADARKCCEGWAAARPADGSPQTLLAHIRSRLNENDAAQTQFSDWVAQHKSFENYTLLFLFNMRESRNQQAFDAIRKSLDEPFVDGSQSWGKFHLAEDAATFSFMQGEYNLALQMCDKMLADARKGDELDRKWDYRSKWQASKMRAAIMVIKGTTADAIAAMDMAARYAKEADEHSNHDAKLRTAIEKNDRTFVSSYTNWNEPHTWVNALPPHYASLLDDKGNIVTPYPKEWKGENTDEE